MNGFWLVCLCGVVLRLVALFLIDGYVPPWDTTTYLELAEGLLRDGELTKTSPVYGELKAAFPPLYPLLLAGAGAGLGINLVTVTLLNIVFDLGSAYALYRIADRKLLAPTIFLCIPSLILYDPMAQKESLSIFLAVMLLWTFMRCLTARRMAVEDAALFGGLTGALALTQPALLPYPFFLALLLANKVSSPVRNAAVIGAVALAVLSPWIVRNWLLFGDIVPLTTSAGLSLGYAVNGEHVRLPGEMLALTEVDRSASVGSAAVQAIMADPGAYARNVARQLAHALFFEKFVLARFMGGAPLLWQLLAVQAAHFGLVGLAALGAFRSPHLWRLISACVLTVAAMMWFEFGERHRYFAYPTLALLASAALAPRHCNSSLTRSAIPGS